MPGKDFARLIGVSGKTLFRIKRSAGVRDGAETGRRIGDHRQVYVRANANKVGIVAEDGTAVTKKAGWFFPGKITELDRGAKVLITGEKDDYYKVRKSDFLGGDWSEGYISKGKLDLQ